MILLKEALYTIPSYIMDFALSTFEFYLEKNLKKETSVKIHDLKISDISEKDKKDYHIKLEFYTLKKDKRLPNADLEKAVRATVLHDMKNGDDRNYHYGVPSGKKFLKVDITPSTNTIDYVVKVRLEKR